MPDEEYSPTSRGTPRGPLAWGLAVILLAAALRFHGLGSKSLWLDEAVSLARITGSFTEMLRDVSRNDGHPPAYYATLHLLTRPFRVSPELADPSSGARPGGPDATRFPPPGITDGILRFPSALAGLVTVLMVLLIERRIAPNRRFPMASALAGISAFAVYYSQDARNYALVGLWVSVSTYFLIRALQQDSPSPACVLGFVGSATLALYTFYYSLFFLVSQALAILLVGKLTRKTWWRWALCFALPVILFLPYLPVVLAMKARVQGAGAPMGLGFQGLDRWLRILPEISQGASPLLQTAGLAGLVACGLLALTPVVVAALSYRRWEAERRFLLLSFAGPILCLLMFPFKPHFVQAKHLFPLVAIYALLLAEGAAGLWEARNTDLPRPAQWAGLIAVILILVANLDSLQWYYREDFVKEGWKDAAAFLEEHLAPGESVIPAPDYLRVPLLRYFPADRRRLVTSAPRFADHQARGTDRQREGGTLTGFWLVELMSSPVSFDDRASKEPLGIRGEPENPVFFPGYEGTIRLSHY